MNPVYILVLSAESQRDITRCLYNSKQNISRLPIAADTSTIQFIHRGDLPKNDIDISLTLLQAFYALDFESEKKIRRRGKS